MYPGRAAGFEWSLGIHLGHFPGDVSLVSPGAEHSWVQLPVCSCTVGAHTPTERKSPLGEPVINSRDTCQAGIAQSLGSCPSRSREEPATSSMASMPVLWDVTGCSLPWLTVVLALLCPLPDRTRDPSNGICHCPVPAQCEECEHRHTMWAGSCCTLLFLFREVTNGLAAGLLLAGFLCRPHLLYRLSCCLPNSGMQNQNFKGKTMVQSEKKK